MTWTVGNGRFVLDDRLRAGSSDEVRLGHLAAEPATRVLVTLTARHAPGVLAQFAASDSVVYAGATDPGVPYEDALVERLPDGATASSRAPIDEAVVVTIAAQLFTWIAELHAKRTRIGGIHPDLVFVIDDRLAGVCPTGIEFIATAPQPMHGPRSYRVPYLAPEVLFMAHGDLPSDVFAACATLFFLGTGRHPFGDASDLRQLMQRTQSGRSEAWPGDAELGEIIASGLARDAGARPSAAALRDRFDQLRARDH